MWRFGVVLVASVVGLASPAWAARVALHSTLTLGGGYVRVVDRDFPDDPVEGVEAREGLQNVVYFDNAYLHVGLSYSVWAVQIEQNHELDYLDHRLAIHIGADRWLRRLAQSGHLTIIADLTVNPSLPPLESANPVTPSADPGTLPADTGGDVPVEPPPPDLPGADNLLTLRQDRSGYSAHYGLAYENDLTPYSSYRTSAVVTDSRFKSSAVADAATLRVSAEYLTQLRVGQAGVGISHGRFVRGGFSDEKTYGVFASLARSSFRSGWRIAPGVAHRTDRRTYAGTLDLSGFIRNRILTYSGGYKIGYVFLQVGDARLAAAHDFELNIHPTRQGRYPRGLTAGARFSSDTTQYTVGVHQGAELALGVHATIGYQRALARWRTADDPSVHQQHADSVTVALSWQFL